MRDGRTARSVGGLDGSSSRREWLAAAITWGTAVAMPRLAQADQYGPVDGQRILIIGDSMIAGGLGLYLARSLGDHGYRVTRRGKSSSGLARPDFYAWEAQARELVGDRPFDATAIMFGGNDVQGLFMGDHQWIRWADEGWAEEYARRVVALCDIVAPEDQWIYWVGMPVMRPPKLHARVQRINTIVRAEMAIRRHAEFIDIWPLLAKNTTEYADRIRLLSEDGTPARTTTRVRANDGIHLTVAGAHYVADTLQRDIHAKFSARSRR